jgi:hypothetical protein
VRYRLEEVREWKLKFSQRTDIKTSRQAELGLPTSRNFALYALLPNLKRLAVAII